MNEFPIKVFRMSLIVIDASSSGAAGDMLIAAFLSLKDKIFRESFCNLFNDHLSRLDPDFHCEWRSVKKNGILGLQIRTKANKKFSAIQLKTILTELCDELSLNAESRLYAETAFQNILEAEKEVHNIKEEGEIHHLHELATIDTIFDIVGFFYLFQQLNLVESELVILPIAVGGGAIKIAHGKTAVPAPATTAILKKGNIFIKGGPIEGELLTPTGAAILTSLKGRKDIFLPLMEINQVGLSFGLKFIDLDEVSGLRVIVGSRSESFIHETINIIETNVDDIDGETIGFIFELLYEKRLVLDLSIINVLTKKNRPGFLIKAIVLPENTDEVTKILTKELGTLGIRVLSSIRHKIPRDIKSRSIMIDEDFETIRIKQAFLGDKIISEKLEFEDIKRIAKKKNLTLKETRKLIYSRLNMNDEENA